MLGDSRAASNCRGGSNAQEFERQRCMGHRPLVLLRGVNVRDLDVAQSFLF